MNMQACRCIGNGVFWLQRRGALRLAGALALVAVLTAAALPQKAMAGDLLIDPSWAPTAEPQAQTEIDLFPAGAEMLPTEPLPAEAEAELEAEARLEAETPLDLPQLLSPADAARYQQIFELQARGKWRRADRLIKKLDDRILMGHVLYQRYMHPTRYRSTYAELHKWLLRYADHPNARRIYKLAVKRHPKSWKWPRAPRAPALGPFAGERRRSFTMQRRIAYGGRGAAVRLPRWARIKLRRYLRRGRPDLADKYFHAKKTRRRLSAARFDLARAKIASSYFKRGTDARGFELASAAADRSRARVPSADWFAGLFAWRLGDYASAAVHFEAFAGSRRSSDWELAAGYYWAARAWLRAGEAAKVNPALGRAASYSRTFYGLLATRQLGGSIDFSWHKPPLEQVQIDRLVKVPAVRRAVALAEAGQAHFADAELKRLYKRAGPGLTEALLGLVTRIPVPATALRMARTDRARRETIFDLALYPMLADETVDGRSVDRALVHALIRQESGFKAKAKSHAGARGLMQLMPNTASFIAADRSLRRRDRSVLFTPEVNLKLGQKYIHHLLRDHVIAGDLLRMVVAYNGGPGNLRKWLRRMDHQDDPLLFIEAIPARETRQYVEKVLANLWIYRHRLGQEIPSLDAIAAGQWPSYIALDGRPGPVASLEEEGHAN